VDCDQKVINLKKCWNQPCFDRTQQPDIKDINLISAGYQCLLYTGYHELSPLGEIFNEMIACALKRGAFDSAKNHKRQRRKRQSVTAKREKSQTPKFV